MGCTTEKDFGPSSFRVPLLIHLRDNKRILSRNGYFNRQIEIADVNDDQTIDETEAIVYAGSSGRGNDYNPPFRRRPAERLSALTRCPAACY